MAGGVPVKRFLAVAAATVLGGASALADAEPPPLFNWSGFYIGGHVGEVSGHGHLDLPTGAVPVRFRADRFLGGGQLGYNWQWMSWVAGVEADISATRLHDGGAFTARGRFGYAAGNFLFYGTGGLAWARERLNTAGLALGCGAILCVPLLSSTSDTRWVGGWAAGGGVDYAFAPNWFVRIEYLRLDFGKYNFNVDPSVSATPLPLTSHFDSVRIGLNYKFGGWNSE